jgi:flagellar basal-body rod protein FlgF
MIRGLYSAATGLHASAQSHEVIAHNLAHLNVTGHRRRGVTFQTFESALARATTVPAPGLGTEVSRGYNNFEPGPIERTGNPLDVALNGDGFFVVQGPGGPLYTRNGTFSLGPNGELLTHDGRPVLSEAGPIALPPGAAPITIGPDGTISTPAGEVGRLRVVRFANPADLEPVGTTFFRAPAGAPPLPNTTGRVVQGYKEGSNVKAVNEMVNMIAANRHYEASQRALRSISDALQLNTRPQGA